jgi:organic radical activating enzyme
LTIVEKDIPVQVSYPVMETFYTLQGEGFHAGRAAYFIRLGGCDVGCVWCDVKESWDASAHPILSLETILDRTWSEIPSQGQLPIVVITGGEPLMYDLHPLIDALHKAGFYVNIETSGSSPLQGKPDWVCLSPKKFKAPLPEVLPLAHELKVVIFNKSDFDWAEKYAKQVNADCRLYLQPEWDKHEQMTPLIVSYIKDNPQWQLSLQTHKYIGVP